MSGREVFQTTNQEPWVEAVLSGRVTAKTRTSKPNIRPGDVVLLHASKSMWPGWRNIKWASGAGVDPKRLHLGCVVGVATVKAVAPSREMLSAREARAWDLDNGRNCAAEWAVRFEDIVRLENPVPARGFQAPYCRAKRETVESVAAANPCLRERLLGEGK